MSALFLDFLLISGALIIPWIVVLSNSESTTSFELSVIPQQDFFKFVVDLGSAAL